MIVLFARKPECLCCVPEKSESEDMGFEFIGKFETKDEFISMFRKYVLSSDDFSKKKKLQFKNITTQNYIQLIKTNFILEDVHPIFIDDTKFVSGKLEFIHSKILIHEPPEWFKPCYNDPKALSC